MQQLVEPQLEQPSTITIVAITFIAFSCSMLAWPASIKQQHWFAMQRLHLVLGLEQR